MNKKTRKIITVGVFSALSIILYYLSFPLPIFPSFLKIQFSNLPVLIAGFSLGLPYGIGILAVKAIIHGITNGAGTMYVGEIADFLIGVAVLLVTTLIYNKNKTKKGAIISLTFGCLTWVIVGAFLNWVLLAPTYIKLFFNGDPSGFIGMCQIIKGINENNYMAYYIFFGTVPFNICLSVMVSIVTYLVYKRVSNFIKAEPKKSKQKEIA